MGFLGGFFCECVVFVCLLVSLLFLFTCFGLIVCLWMGFFLVGGFGLGFFVLFCFVFVLAG